MHETLTIRPGSLADLDKFSEFWLSMFEEVGNFCEADFPATWRSDFEAYFRRRIGDGDAAFFVAVDGESVVGTAGALLRDGYPTVVNGVRQGYIFGVRVEPEYRRRGIAERLTREAIGFLEGKRCWKIRLHASRFGRAIYERIGFVPTNEMELR
jgi:ribosomal protein S18 acetylase RimI-like enzyme